MSECYKGPPAGDHVIYGKLYEIKSPNSNYIEAKIILPKIFLALLGNHNLFYKTLFF